MNPTKTLHNLGQSLWLDNITRDLLNSGTLQRYIDEFSVTGLTSNPTIFDHAIKNSRDYEASIRETLGARIRFSLVPMVGQAEHHEPVPGNEVVLARVDGIRRSGGWTGGRLRGRHD